ncbi:MAG: DnaB-like helicase C-terminal domain-containing protein [Pseudomonadota bacterium]
MTVLDYIQSRGFEYKIKSGQIVLQTCPFCGDQTSHFYIDQGEEGLFFCHKCNERGNLITLKKHLGDYERPSGSNGTGQRKNQAAINPAFSEKRGGNHRPNEKVALEAHERLLSNTEIQKYVTETRGLSMETVKDFKLGLETDRQGVRWLTIPHYADGKLLNIKSRSLPPAEKHFRRVTDCKSVLFNSDVIKGAEELFVCEGEIDTLTLLDQGIKNAVGATNGAGSFDPEWIDQLSEVKKIYLVYDADKAGQKGSREVARRLGYDRCFNVLLPDGEDVNSYFTSGHDIFEFQALVNQARQFDVAGIESFQSGLDKLQAEIDRPDQEIGLTTPWQSLNRLVRTGFQAGDLVVISAPPKIGKSSLALQITTFNGLQDIPSLFFCLEMRPQRLVSKIVQCETKAESIGPASIERARRAFEGKPLYLGYCYQKPELNGIIQTLKEAIKRYGLRLVVFDHLHFLCRSVSNQVQEVSLAVQAFKFLAEEMEIPIILIAQPRKTQPDVIMTAQDLKDSSAIYSDCDHLIILHRNRKVSTAKNVNAGMETVSQAFEPVTLVRVEASRYNAGGESLLYFHGEYSRFDEVVRQRCVP